MKSCMLFFIISLYGVTGVEASYYSSNSIEGIFEGKVISGDSRRDMCSREGYYRYNDQCLREDWIKKEIDSGLATDKMMQEHSDVDARGREEERLKKAQEKEKVNEGIRDICNQVAGVASLINPMYGIFANAAGSALSNSASGDKTNLMGTLIELLPGMVAGNIGDNANSAIENLREEARKDLIIEALKKGQIH